MCSTSYLTLARLRMEHVPGPQEPLLWIPYIVAGAYSDLLAGKDATFAPIADSVEVIVVGQKSREPETPTSGNFSGSLSLRSAKRRHIHVVTRLRGNQSTNGVRLRPSYTTLLDTTPEMRNKP